MNLFNNQHRRGLRMTEDDDEATTMDGGYITTAAVTTIDP
jgi:hypothetical protein